jgi:prepilin-type processing-associated H-X9-DG protein
MRDELVRYLLGELNTQEQEQLEALLRDSPELRRELEHLRLCLPGDGDECEFDAEDAEFDRPQSAGAPTGLADRTLSMICDGGACAPRKPAEIAAAYDPPAGTPSWGLVDLTVAGGVFLAISMLFVPALRQSRDAARRTDCANNLRQVSTMLISYAETKGRFFPTPTRHENAGIFAVYLVEEGYAGPDELARLLLCRASPVADDVVAKRINIRVPTMCELAAATAKERCFWKRMMSPCYAYRIGFVEDGQYCAVRNESSCRKAMLADAPCKKLKNLQSEHHGGQNIAFQDGHVRYQRDSTLPEEHQDPIYLNDAGNEAAGLDRDDTVLGRSEVTPGNAGLQFAP